VFTSPHEATTRYPSGSDGKYDCESYETDEPPGVVANLKDMGILAKWILDNIDISLEQYSYLGEVQGHENLESVIKDLAILADYTE